MLITCSKKIYFCCAHRLLNHPGECGNLHGHNYELQIYAKASNDNLTNIGTVIDFKLLKNRIEEWINQNWDHNTIIFEKDDELINLLSNLKQQKKGFILPYNPTSENLGHFLIQDICPLLFSKDGIIIYKIDIYESNSSVASVEI